MTEGRRLSSRGRRPAGVAAAEKQAKQEALAAAKTLKAAAKAVKAKAKAEAASKRAKQQRKKALAAVEKAETATRASGIARNHAYRTAAEVLEGAHRLFT